MPPPSTNYFEPVLRSWSTNPPPALPQHLGRTQPAQQRPAGRLLGGCREASGRHGTDAGPHQDLVPPAQKDTHCRVRLPPPWRFFGRLGGLSFAFGVQPVDGPAVAAVVAGHVRCASGAHVPSPRVGRHTVPLYPVKARSVRSSVSCSHRAWNDLLCGPWTLWQSSWSMMLSTSPSGRNWVGSSSCRSRRAIFLPPPEFIPIDMCQGKPCYA